MGEGFIRVDEDRCKGCGLCVDACPRAILALSTVTFNARGYRAVEVTDMEACTGCAVCAIVCPDVVFRVYRRAKSAATRGRTAA